MYIWREVCYELLKLQGKSATSVTHPVQYSTVQPPGSEYSYSACIAHSCPKVCVTMKVAAAQVKVQVLNY